MHQFILIFALFSGHMTPGVAVSGIRFDNEQACIAAKFAVIREAQTEELGKAKLLICVPAD